MRSFMLWFMIKSPKPLSDKIADAATYFKKKYGMAPSLCYLNPKDIAGGVDIESELTVRPMSNVLPSHLWMGVEDKS